jgi:enamine deaminase RidA (YjgF/YER057c/UK114 family)
LEEVGGMEKATIYSHAVGKVLPMKLRYWPRWSLGHRTAHLIFASGQPGVDNHGTVLAPGDPSRQTHDALENLRRIVEAGGGHFADVFWIRVFLAFSEDYDATVGMVDAYLREQFPRRDLPAISYAVSPVGATRDRRMLLAEIEAFASTDRTTVHSDRLFSGFAERYPVDGYAHATRVGNLVFTSGFLGTDERGRLVSEDPVRQAERAFANLELALDAAGVSGGELVKLTTYVDSEATFDAVRGVRSSFLHDHFKPGEGPATTTMAVSVGLPGSAILVQAVAADGPRQLVISDAAYTHSPDGDRYAQAVKVRITSHEGSYLQRFTWPSYPSDADRTALGLELERQQSLGYIVFLSSQAPLDRDGNLVDRADVGAQTRQVFENIRTICEAAGGSFSDILQVDIYVDSAESYPGFNEMRVRFSEEHYPDKNWFCGSGVSGTSLVEGAKVEIESVAAIAWEDGAAASEPGRSS